MRRTLLAVVVVATIGHGGTACGMGGDVNRPSLAIPADPKTKEMDRVVKKLAEVLQGHQKVFTGGSGLNSHSVLYFGGKTAGVNALLGDLAKVEGATIQVKFSKEVGVTRWMFPIKDTPTDLSCDCEIDHLAWGDARTITLTIYLGGGRIEPETLDLPPVAGRPAAPSR